MRGGTALPQAEPCSVIFQSTRPVRGGTVGLWITDVDSLFQSTRPVRGGTYGYKLCERDEGAFQSTRPVRGGTVGHARGPPAELISIHPPRAGRDGLILLPCCLFIGFQSTRPVRGGTFLN